MAEINLPAFSICPLRSPVFPPENSLVGPDGGTPEPRAMLGPCLYAGCGMFVPTQVENGQVLNGICGIRGMAVGLELLNRNLTKLTKIAERVYATDVNGAAVS